MKSRKQEIPKLKDMGYHSTVTLTGVSWLLSQTPNTVLWV